MFQCVKGCSLNWHIHMAEYVSWQRDISYLNKGRLLLIKLINRDYRIHVWVYI